MKLAAFDSPLLGMQRAALFAATLSQVAAQSFGPEQLISTTATGAQVTFAIDLDGDGDPDVVSAFYSNDQIAWSENLGGGSFGPQQVIATDVDSARAVDGADFDGDGDIDVVATAFDGREVVWFENWGQGTAYCRPAVMSGVGLRGKNGAYRSAVVADNALTLVAADGHSHD